MNYKSVSKYKRCNSQSTGLCGNMRIKSISRIVIFLHTHTVSAILSLWGPSMSIIIYAEINATPEANHHLNLCNKQETFLPVWFYLFVQKKY